MKVDGNMGWLIVVGARSNSVGMAIEVENEASIWLEMSGVVNECHVVEDDGTSQGLVFISCVVMAKLYICVAVRGVSWWRIRVCRWWNVVDMSLMCFDAPIYHATEVRL